MAETEERITRWINCERRALLRALKRADLVAQGDSHRAILKVGQGTLEVRADGMDLGESSESVSVDLQGDPIEIAFNAGYLAEGLRVLQGDGVSLAMGRELDSAVLKADGDRYVIMPMHVM